MVDAGDDRRSPRSKNGRGHSALLGLRPREWAVLAVGLLCLLLTPLAYRIRTTPPPLGVTVIAAIVGASPLVVLLLISSLGR